MMVLFAAPHLSIVSVIRAGDQYDHTAIRLQAGDLSLRRARVAALLWPSDWLIAVDTTGGDPGSWDTG